MQVDKFGRSFLDTILCKPDMSANAQAAETKLKLKRQEQADLLRLQKSPEWQTVEGIILTYLLNSMTVMTLNPYTSPVHEKTEIYQKGRIDMARDILSMLENVSRKITNLEKNYERKYGKQETEHIKMD